MGLASQENVPSLGIALIGAGMVAKTHMAAIAHAQPAVTLSGVLSRTPSKTGALIAGFAEQFEKPPAVYQTLDDVLADETVEAAVIVTPPNVREDLIAPLARAGKHILLEKPVARTLEEAGAVVALCEEAGVTLSIVFQHRFREASRAAKDLIDSGELGELGLAEIAVPYWRGQDYYDELGRGTYARDGGGVLISQAIHTIDLVNHLVGPVKSIQAMTAKTRFHRMEAEDVAVAGLTFANGAAGSFVATTASYPGGAETITLHFDKASLRLDSGVLTVSWRDGRVETHGAAGGTGGGADPMAFTHEWHQSVLEDFADAVACGRTPLVTGRQALAAHAFIHAIEQSAKEGRMAEVSS